MPTNGFSNKPLKARKQPSFDVPLKPANRGVPSTNATNFLARERNILSALCARTGHWYDRGRQVRVERHGVQTQSLIPVPDCYVVSLVEWGWVRHYGLRIRDSSPFEQPTCLELVAGTGMPGPWCKAGH